MTALSQDRITPQKASKEFRSLPVKANTKLYAGSMAALDASGLLVPMSTGLGLKGVGRNERQVNNTGANGAVIADVKRGTFRFANSSAGDLITLADIGSDCYGVDDQTVAKTNGTNTRSVAGRVYDVDADGVWVEFY
jgi:hypothetical protein